MFAARIGVGERVSEMTTIAISTLHQSYLFVLAQPTSTTADDGGLGGPRERQQPSEIIHNNAYLSFEILLEQSTDEPSGEENEKYGNYGL